MVQSGKETWIWVSHLIVPHFPRYSAGSVPLQSAYLAQPVNSQNKNVDKVSWQSTACSQFFISCLQPTMEVRERTDIRNKEKNDLKNFNSYFRGLPLHYAFILFHAWCFLCWTYEVIEISCMLSLYRDQTVEDCCWQKCTVGKMFSWIWTIEVADDFLIA